MTRAAVVVFIETTHDGGPVDAAVLLKQALHSATGNRLTVEDPRLGAIGITVHEVLEAGLAAGNGYLWTSPTSKAFPQANVDEA